MNQPLVSIIVPVYNVAPYLEQCVESIRTQSYSNFQCFLVDDGSTDGSFTGWPGSGRLGAATSRPAAS